MSAEKGAIEGCDHGEVDFLDCMALGIPVITSDNTCFAGDVEKYGLGIIL